jgi:predicted amidohydrolase
MKIALIQQHATTDRAANLLMGLEAARQAAVQGAEVICFAELSFDRFLPQVQSTPELLSRAETIPGPTTDAFREIAIDKKVVIVLNLFELAGGFTFDSSPVIDADGIILGVTRMIHITEYEYFHEQGYYTPGDNGIVIYDTRYGKIGVAICYDRHYPEYMRALGVAGAEVVIIPQAGSVGEWPDGLYEAEMQVAAFQNGYYTALCNRVGEEENLTFAGESFVCGPDGRVLAQAPEGEDAILHVDLNLKQVGDSHARTLFMRDRRPELYGDWLGRK